MENTFEGWENAGPVEDFFSEDFNTDTADIVEEALKEEEDIDLKEPKHEEKEEDQDSIDLFNDYEEGTSDQGGGESPDTETPGSHLSLYKTLKERGLVSLDPEEGEDLTEELAEELIDEGLEGFVDSKIREKLNSLPEDVQNIVKYTLTGGSLKDYLSSVDASSMGIPSNIDLSQEENQEFVTRSILREEGNSEETIESQIEFLRDSGKLKQFSEDKHKIWSNKKREEEERILKDREERARDEKLRIKRSKQDIFDTLNKSNNIKGFVVPKKIVKEIPSYMEDRTVPLSNGNYISELQRDLYYELPKNKEALMQLAVLMKNRNEDGTFNFESIAKNIETEVVKGMKRDIRRSKPVVPNSSSGSSRAGKSLASYF